MGMPGKPEGIDGAEVEPYFLDGRIKEIAEYCETDVVNTYRVWLRYELFRGRLTESEHQASERSLADFIAARVWPLAAHAVGFLDSRPLDAIADRLRGFRQGLNGGASGRLDSGISLRTNARVISSMRLHTTDRDCARRSWQVR